MMVQGFTPLSGGRSLTTQNQSSAQPAPAPIVTRRGRLVSGGPFPDCLPTCGFYDRHPEKVGPTANVLITDFDALQPWLLVARPVSRAEAKALGGCLMYNPTLNQGEGKATQESLYYCISDCDDVVYGRAAYLPRGGTATPKAMQETTGLVSSPSSASSRDCITEESASEVNSPCLRTLPKAFGSTSCCCVYPEEPTRVN